VVRGILEDEPGALIIPAPVSAEVDYMLRRRLGAHAARAFLADLADGRFQVDGLTREEHGIVLSLHDRYVGLDLGLTDLSVIVLAHRHRTRRLVTFDERDFRPVSPIQGGTFTLLPTDL
jgi:predicted nucleic acid-binding protein